MRTVRCAAILALVAGVGLLANSATADTVILDDNFESYADQTAFEAAWPVVATAPGGTNYLVTTGPTVNPPNDDPLVLPPEGSGQMVGHLNTATRNERAVGEIGNVTHTQFVRFSFDFYDVDATQSPYRHHTNLQDSPAPTGTNQLIAMGMNNNQNAVTNGGNRYMGRILGYNPAEDTDGPGSEVGGASGSFFKLNDFGDAGLRTTGWHNLRVDVTLADAADQYLDYYFYVDDVLAEQVINVGSALTFLTNRSFDHIRLGSGLTSGTFLAYTDNIKLELIDKELPPADNADFDGDGDVDGADFLIFQRGVGISDGSALRADGDANDDGNVDELDYPIFTTQFGTNPNSSIAASAVPEPATYGLALLALAGAAALRRRR